MSDFPSRIGNMAALIPLIAALLAHNKGEIATEAT
jgi:hypothetical protein